MTAAVDFGQDTSCVSDFDPSFRVVSGLRLLGEACVRRLITPLGGLLDDANYGYDVRQFLNDDVDPATIAVVASGVDAELVKDERVLSSSTVVTFAGGALVIVSTVTTAAGPFALVLSVSSVTVTLLQPTP